MAVASGKGGVGKTLITINIGRILSKKRQKGAYSRWRLGA